MKKYLSCLSLCLWLCGFTTQAQTGVSGEIKVDYIPFSNYVRPIDSLKTESTSDFRRMQMALDVPLSIEVDAYHRPKVWSVFLQGSYAKMQNRNYSENLFPTELLNAQIGVKYLCSIAPTWSVFVVASIGVYTDMERINSDDILAQGGVIFIKHFNPNLGFGVGPVLTNNFGVPMVLPGIYFNWQSEGALHFRVNFPEGLELGYRVSKALDIKAIVELNGMTAEINQGGESMLLGYQQVTAGMRPQLKLGEHFTLELTAGSTLIRSFSTNNRKLKDFFKTKELADPRFTTTFYGAAALKWKF